MQAVTNDQGQKGFYDESLGFIPVDSLQQVTDPQGQKGYWSGKTGFIPAPAETSSLSKWREKWAGKESFTGLNEASDTASEKISKIWSPKGNESVLQSGLKIPGRVFDTAGELAGAGTKVIGQTAVNAAKGIYNVTTPEETKKMEAETFQAFLDTPIAKTGVAALQQGQKYFDLFAKTHPDAARHLIEGFNLFGAGAFNKSFKVLGEAVDFGKMTESAKAGSATIKETIYPTPSKDEALGQVLQGKSETLSKDYVKGERAFAAVNTEGVKDFAELHKRLTAAVPKYAEKVDAELAKDQTLYNMEQLSTEQPITIRGQAETVEKVSPIVDSHGKPIITEKTIMPKTKVTVNYVEKALNDLAGIYEKTGQEGKAQDALNLLKKAKKQGLTKLEVNNIARQYSNEYDAFNPRTGVPLTSTSAESWENTRKGLKEISRRGLDNTTKELDTTLSSILNTDRLVKKSIEAVNTAKQRIEKSGLGVKLAHHLITLIDIGTGGALKGATRSLLSKGTSESMKMVEIEAKLERNLKVINKALAAKSDAEMISVIQNGFKK